MSIHSVAEIQGLYGPITVAETLLQKIWHQGDFGQHKLTTLEGLPLRIHNRGTWNRLEGPDFKQAEIEVDGQHLVGDIEIHFYARDWFRHKHDRNAHFKDVSLHVVLFDPSPKEQALFQAQTNPRFHTLVFLPLLEQDIEAYAMQEAFLAIERSTDTEQLDAWMLLTPQQRRSALRDKARHRWEQKVIFAQQRLEQTNWNEACHQACLETLGYRRNRTPMVHLATRFPLAEMARQGRQAEDYFALVKEDWKLAGLRPANHPLRRLEQYLKLLAQRPDWPESLQAIHLGQASISMTTADFRRHHRLSQQKQFFQNDLLAPLGGTRLDTFICDAVLPLLSVSQQTDLFPFWFHWFGGDIPDSLIAFEKAIEILDGKSYPASNGMHQGALQTFIEEGLN